MDVHRSFAQIAVVEDGLCHDEGRIGVTPEELRAWAAGLDLDDEIALEATTNSDAIATMLRPLVRRVVVSNPRKTRAIAEAKVKTDRSTRGSWRSCWRPTSCPKPGSRMTAPGCCGGWWCGAPILFGSAPG